MFVHKTEQTLQYFVGYYGWSGSEIEWQRHDRFLRRPYSLVVWQDRILEQVLNTGKLSNQNYALMKDYAKAFIPRIKKCFGQQLVISHVEKTPLQDAEHLINASNKLTYKWAAGIIVSNHLASVLVRLSKFSRNEKFNDDIKTLYETLKNKTSDIKLKRFLVRSYRRFEDANKTRNRCAHLNEGEPTRQEIEQSISLARLLQAFEKH
jgi:hypothetical protein